MRIASLAITGVLLAACGTFDDTVPANPPREVFGISAAVPERAQAEAARPTLEWKVSQICVRGGMQPAERVEPAEANRQLVDWQLRCDRYRLLPIATPAFFDWTPF